MSNTDLDKLCCKFGLTFIKQDNPYIDRYLADIEECIKYIRAEAVDIIEHLLKLLKYFASI